MKTSLCWDFCPRDIFDHFDSLDRRQLMVVSLLHECYKWKARRWKLVEKKIEKICGKLAHFPLSLERLHQPVASDRLSNWKLSLLLNDATSQNKLLLNIFWLLTLNFRRSFMFSIFVVSRWKRTWLHLGSTSWTAKVSPNWKWEKPFRWEKQFLSYQTCHDR